MRPYLCFPTAFEGKPRYSSEPVNTDDSREKEKAYFERNSQNLSTRADHISPQKQTEKIEILHRTFIKCVRQVREVCIAKNL